MVAGACPSPRAEQRGARYRRQSNLALRVPGLSLRRLAGDMRREHGHAVLLAESFVDRAKLAGSRCRATNWRSPGFTAG